MSCTRFRKEDRDFETIYIPTLALSKYPIPPFNKTSPTYHQKQHPSPPSPSPSPSLSHSPPSTSARSAAAQQPAPAAAVNASRAAMCWEGTGRCELRGQRRGLCGGSDGGGPWWGRSGGWLRDGVRELEEEGNDDPRQQMLGRVGRVKMGDVGGA